MPDIVCVDIVVDTQDLLAAYPQPSEDAEAPTRVETDSCYLIAPPAYSQKGLATAHLHLAVKALPAAADVDDDADEDSPVTPPQFAVIQWRTFSLSGNASQAATLYDIEPLHHVRAPSLAVAAEVAKPRPILANARNTDPPTFEVVLGSDYYIQTPILGEGSGRFRMSFYVTETEPEEGGLRVLGYFSWTSTLSVAFD